MAQTRIASAIFIVLVSVNVIQAVLPQFFHEDTFPNYMNLVDATKIDELSHSAASSEASAAANPFTGFKTHIDNFRTGLRQYIQVPPETHIDNFRTGLRQYIQVPPEYPILHHIIHGDIRPSQRVGIVPSPLVAPGLYGKYGGYVRDSDAASAAAASAAASGGLSKRKVV